MFRNILIALCVSATATLANAKEVKTVKKEVVQVARYTSHGYQHEFSATYSDGFLATTSNYTQIKVGADYQYLIQDGIQVGADAALQILSVPGISQTNIGIYATGAYNFLNYGSFDEAFYVKMGVGLVNARLNLSGTGKDEMAFSFLIAGGKRFPLWDHVTYKPELEIGKVGSSDLAILAKAFNIAIEY